MDIFGKKRIKKLEELVLKLKEEISCQNQSGTILFDDLVDASYECGVLRRELATLKSNTCDESSEVLCYQVDFKGDRYSLLIECTDIGVSDGAYFFHELDEVVYSFPIADVELITLVEGIDEVMFDSSKTLYNYTLILPGSVKIEIVADSHKKLAIGSWEFSRDDKVCSSYDNILGFSRSPVEK